MIVGHDLLQALTDYRTIMSDLATNKSDLELQLQGYGLITAELLYRMPDHPHLLQSFIWQHYDLAPKFPELHQFIEFWKKEIEGRLYSVVYTHKRLISPGEWRNVTGELILH